MKKSATIFSLALAICFPSVSEACSVCGGGTAAKADAYIIFTALLASLPVVLFGLLGYWIYRHYRQVGE